jgi:phasin
MLFLIARNFWWAAWWPYMTWLLAMQKAADQATARSRASEDTRGHAGGPVPQESKMANDAFMKPELPEPLRDLMKMSIEQARKAFETFAASSEKAWKSFETSSQSARASLQQLNAKIAEITRANAEANFNLAIKLAECKDIAQAMELQSQHVRNQMDKFVHQLEEMRDLTTKIIQEATPANTEFGQAPAPRGQATTASASSGHSYPSSTGGYKPRNY